MLRQDKADNIIAGMTLLELIVAMRLTQGSPRCQWPRSIRAVSSLKGSLRFFGGGTFLDSESNCTSPKSERRQTEKSHPLCAAKDGPPSLQRLSHPPNTQWDRGIFEGRIR